jgi:hypothetical protein
MAIIETGGTQTLSASSWPESGALTKPRSLSAAALKSSAPSHGVVRNLLRAAKIRLWYNGTMTKDRFKEILNRVLSWPADDQEKVARFVREVEQRRADDDISEEEWEIIEARAARRDLATEKEVEQVFSRYRGA